MGWSALLKQQVNGSELSKPLEVIHRNAQAQVRIIDDILDVSRVITGKLQLNLKATDLAQVVRNALESIRPSAEAKRILLDFVPEAETCPMFADPVRLQQVVWNLLSNAVKFTPSGGRVHVLLGQANSQLVLTVRDTGQGIEPSFLPLVFDRFTQADSSTTRRLGGLGLGLAIVRHIVELHGGRVDAGSAGEGQGASFTVTLPVRAVAASVDSSPRRQRHLGPAVVPPHVVLKGVRVLVVDDEPDARDLIAAVLGGAGAEVVTAASAVEAYPLFARFRADVLVSDVGMPDEDGFAFIRRIRTLQAAEGGAVPALALTAFAREEDRATALRAGYTAYLAKPVDPEILAAAVANLATVGRRS